MRGRPNRPTVLALLLLLAAGTGVFAVYRLVAPAWTVDLGGPFSGALVQGFYDDEVAGGARYRWSAGHGAVTLRDVGADTPLLVGFRVGARPPAAPAPVVFTLTIDSRLVTTYTQGADPAVYTATVTARPPGDPDVRLAFDAPPFQVPGDARALGLRLEQVRVAPAPGAPPPTPSGAVLLWVALVTLGMYFALWRLLRRPFWAAAGGLVVLGLLLAGLAAARSLLTPWLPALAAFGAAAGLLALLWPFLARWPEWLDGLADPRGLVAPALLALLLLAYAAFALAVLPDVAWIGHADYADNAVVARNLVDGRGLVVDYAAQFYRAYPGITHPADTWPILQPILIAAAFWLFGPATWIAKLPNLALLLALAVAVYHFAGQWWDRRVGLLAALLTLLHPYFFQTVLYPINDLAFTLCALLTVGWAAQAVGSGQWAGIGDRGSGIGDRGSGVGGRGSGTEEDESVGNTQHATGSTQHSVLSTQHSALGTHSVLGTRYSVLAGLAAGGLVWSKGTSGLVVLAGLVGGLALAALTTRWAGRRPPRDWRPWAWMAGTTALVLLPWLLRNWLTFGAPFYSTEQYDVWILRFYTGGTGLPWEHIYADYLDGRPLPDRALLLRSYDTLYAAVAWGFQTLWKGGVLNGDILPLPSVLAGAAGWLLAPAPLRRLRLAWLGALGGYGLFVLLAWHYEPRYFLAAVPWFYVGTAAFLGWVWDRLRAPIPAAVAAGAPRPRALWPEARSRERAPAALAVLPLAVLALVWPMAAAVADQAAAATGPDSFATAGQWVAAQLPAGAVVMTRNPWEFNWYARRKAVMIPEGSLADVQAIVARYGVGYLWVGGRGDSARLRPQLAPLYGGRPLPGLATQPVYAADGIYIYRLGAP